MLCPFPNLSLDSATRVDPYRFVHKAIRAMLGSLVETAGRTDFADEGAVARLRTETIDAVHLLEAHARAEVQFLDSLLGTCAPAEANDVQREHAELDAELVTVLEELDLAFVEDGDEALRARGHAFYLRLARFAASYLVHMADEELRILGLLHRHVDEILLRRALLAAQASLPHAERAKLHTRVLDALTPHERDLFFASSRPGRNELDPRAIVRSGALERRAVHEEQPGLDASDEARALERS